MAVKNKTNVLTDTPVPNKPVVETIARAQDAQNTTIENAIRLLTQELFTPKIDVERFQRGKVVKVINNPNHFLYSQKRELEKLTSSINDKQRYKVVLLNDILTSIPFSYNDVAIMLLPDYSVSPTFEGTLKEGMIVVVDVFNNTIEYSDDKALNRSATVPNGQTNNNASPSNVAGEPTTTPPSAQEAFNGSDTIRPIPPGKYINPPPTTTPASEGFTEYAMNKPFITPVVFGNSCAKDPENYKKCIDQFAVQFNPRYSNNIINPSTGKTDTFCNIFGWDVTIAMGCKNYPHWISTKDQTVNGVSYKKNQPVNCNFKMELKPNYKKVEDSQAVEIGANAQARWVRQYAEQFGWQILSGPEEAQKVANEGRLVIANWENTTPNPNGGNPGAGHVIVIRPDETQYDNKRGPRMSQAGARNVGDCYFAYIYGENSRKWHEYTYTTPKCDQPNN